MRTIKETSLCGKVDILGLFNLQTFKKKHATHMNTHATHNEQNKANQLAASTSPAL